MADTSRIHSLVARGRRRLKLQSALDAAVLAVIPAAAAAAAVVFLVRSEILSEGAGLALLVGAAGGVLAAGLGGLLRRFPTEVVATRIDRASGLADRLATACAFEEELRRPPREGASAEEDETRALMEAAVEDAVRLAPRADVRAATPFAWPRDTRPALAFAAVAALVAGLTFELPPVEPAIATCDPVAAPRTAEIEVRGVRFGERGRLLLGEGPDAVPAEVVDWTPTSIRARVPREAEVGHTVLVVEAGEHRSAPLRFEVLPDGVRLRDRDEPVALAEDDLDYTRDLLAELKESAEANEDQELTQLAAHIEKLLDQAEKGQISREELLAELAKAHEEYMKGADEKLLAEGLKDLEKTGAELQKSELTKEMGKALAKGDLENAREEMEKLAEKLAKGEISEKDAAKAAEAMEKAAEAFDKRQAQRDKTADKKVDKAQQEVAKAEKQAAQAKTPEQKEQAERRLAQKKKELEQAQKDREQQEKAAEKRTLKRLHRNMKQAAEQMREQNQNQEQRRQASRTMQDMARETGKVDADRRKITNQKKVASQLEDLREAMQRAKRGGSRGPQDRFGRNKRNADFQKRARGGQGSRGAWKPGQGKPGQGNQPGGQGNQPGGDSYGDGHDPNIIGDETARKGNTKDEAVSGIHGKGPSQRETILSSAQKGFASRSYKEVYARYRTIVEEVINAEKVPSGYKYYVKKYFQKIKPHEM